jgi:hypothetical protein
MNHAFSSAGKIARCGSSFLRASPFSTIGSKTISITFVDIDVSFERFFCAIDIISFNETNLFMTFSRVIVQLFQH